MGVGGSRSTTLLKVEWSQSLESYPTYVECLLPKSGLFLRVGGHQRNTLNVIYHNVCHTLKFMKLPVSSSHCMCELRNPRLRVLLKWEYIIGCSSSGNGLFDRCMVWLVGWWVCDVV